MNKAPQFTLLNDQNQPISLADFRGQRVLIFFFPKAGTPGCTVQACGFRDNFPKITEQNATVIGISPDLPAELARWKAQHNLPYTLLSDPNHSVAEAFGVWTERSMFGHKYMGISRSHFIIDTAGNIEVEEKKVSPLTSVHKGTKSLVGGTRRSSRSRSR